MERLKQKEEKLKQREQELTKKKGVFKAGGVVKSQAARNDSESEQYEVTKEQQNSEFRPVRNFQTKVADVKVKKLTAEKAQEDLKQLLDDLKTTDGFIESMSEGLSEEDILRMAREVIN